MRQSSLRYWILFWPNAKNWGWAGRAVRAVRTVRTLRTDRAVRWYRGTAVGPRRSQEDLLRLPGRLPPEGTVAMVVCSIFFGFRCLPAVIALPGCRLTV